MKKRYLTILSFSFLTLFACGIIIFGVWIIEQAIIDELQGVTSGKYFTGWRREETPVAFASFTITKILLGIYFVVSGVTLFAEMKGHTIEP